MKTEVIYDGIKFIYEEKDGNIILYQQHSSEVNQTLEDPEIQEGFQLYLTDL